MSKLKRDFSKKKRWKRKLRLNIFDMNHCISLNLKFFLICSIEYLLHTIPVNKLLYSNFDDDYWKKTPTIPHYTCKWPIKNFTYHFRPRSLLHPSRAVFFSDISTYMYIATESIISMYVQCSYYAHNAEIQRNMYC